MDKRAWAVKLASDYGFHVFPIKENGKIPFWEEWERKASNDPATVHRYWTEHVTGGPLDYNIGIATGPSNLCVIDYDVKHGQDPWQHRDRLLSEIELLGHDALTVDTPTGGQHLYFRSTRPLRNRAGHLGAGIDTRADGGFVVAPGSEIDGKPYTFSGGNDIPTLPEHLANQIGAPKKRDTDESDFTPIDLDDPDAIARATNYLLHAAPEAIEGAGGDLVTYTIAARVKDFGISQSTCFDLMSEHWNESGKAIPPWNPEDLLAKIGNAYRYGENPPGVANPAIEFEPVALLNSPTAKAKRDDIHWLEPFNPGDLSQRQWVVDNLLARGYLTGLIAPSGAGKTQFLTQLLASIASGKSDPTGFSVHERTKVWYFNQEDDLTELKRRLGAAIKHFGITWPELRQRIALDSGVERPLMLVKRNRTGQLTTTPDVDWVIEQIKLRNVGVFLIDPLTEFHEAEENNNVEMRFVAAALRRIAVEANCAVMIGHHSKKPDQGASTGFAGVADSARGASALQGVTRIMVTLYAASEKDAKQWAGIDEHNRHEWVRLDGAKSNLSLAAGGARPTWFRRTGVDLQFEGDNIGVLQPEQLQKVESRVKRGSEEDMEDEDWKARQWQLAVADAISACSLDGGQQFGWSDIVPKLAELTGRSEAGVHKKVRRDFEAGEHWWGDLSVKLYKKPGRTGDVIVAEKRKLDTI